MSLFKNAKKFHLIQRLKSLIFLHIQHLPMNGHGTRPYIVRLGGVKIEDPSKTFIGEEVLFDTVHPDLIIIEKGVRITMRSIILTHFKNSADKGYSSGVVHIKERAFLGANTIITKPVTIGKGAIVGAGSIVTKDIPDYEVWAGNPAKFIRKINIE